MSRIVLSLSNIQRRFTEGRGTLEVLRGVDLVLRRGEVVALVGPSGAGKSTLLQIAGLLDKPDGGAISLDDQDCSALNDDRRTAMRRQHLGFVYQYHHLLPEFSALENIVIPQAISNVPRAKAEYRAQTLLSRLGIEARSDHRPGQLSGGEQQRVAIARALATSPKMLLADEPTGNLDPNTASGVFDMFMQLAHEDGLAALVATHNPDLAARMDRVVSLENGVLADVTVRA